MNKEKIVNLKTSYSVSIVNNKVDSLRITDDKTTSIRVYDDNRIGVSGGVGEADEEKLTENATKNLDFGVNYPCGFTAGIKKSIDKSKTLPSADAFMKQVGSLINKLSEKYPDYIFSNKINVETEKTEYSNSLDTELSYSDSVYNVSLLIKSKSSADIFDLGYGATNEFFDENAIIRDVSVLLDAYGKVAGMPKEKLPVIIDSEVLFGYVAEGVVAGMFLSGASLFSGKLGQRIFNEKVDFLIDRSENNARQAPFFDSEGVINDGYKFDIIKKGVLTGLLANKRTAKTYGIPVSGSAYSSFDSVPVTAGVGFACKETCEEVSEIVKGKAIYVCMTSGGDITPAGDLGLPVMLAFLYEDGKLVARLPEFGIGGNLFDVLGKNFIGVCKNFVFGYDKQKTLVAYFDINK